MAVKPHLRSECRRTPAASLGRLDKRAGTPATPGSPSGAVWRCAATGVESQAAGFSGVPCFLLVSLQQLAPMSERTKFAVIDCEDAPKWAGHESIWVAAYGRPGEHWCEAPAQQSKAAY